MEFTSRTVASHIRRSDAIRRWMDSDTAKAPMEGQERNIKIRFESGALLLSAVSSGDIKETERLLEEGADVNYSSIDGLTSLHQACIDENLEMVELLVRKGAIIDACDNEGWTPLHAAASTTSVETIKYLIEKGANVTAVNTDGELPMDLAEDPAVKAFLESEMKKTNISLDDARRLEHKMLMDDALKWQQQGCIMDVRDVQGATALHVSASKGYIDVLRILVAIGADINCVDNDGWTPLHAAVYWKQEEVCQVLLDLGANFHARNSSGQCPMDLADDEMLPFMRNLARRFKVPETSNSCDRITGMHNSKTTREASTLATCIPPYSRVQTKPLVSIMKNTPTNSTASETTGPNFVSSSITASAQLSTASNHHRLGNTNGSNSSTTSTTTNNNVLESQQKITIRKPTADVCPNAGITLPPSRAGGSSCSTAASTSGVPTVISSNIAISRPPSRTPLTTTCAIPKPPTTTSAAVSSLTGDTTTIGQQLPPNISSMQSSIARPLGAIKSNSSVIGVSSAPTSVIGSIARPPPSSAAAAAALTTSLTEDRSATSKGNVVNTTSHHHHQSSSSLTTGSKTTTLSTTEISNRESLVKNNNEMNKTKDATKIGISMPSRPPVTSGSIIGGGVRFPPSCSTINNPEEARSSSSSIRVGAIFPPSSALRDCHPNKTRAATSVATVPFSDDLTGGGEKTSSLLIGNNVLSSMGEGRGPLSSLMSNKPPNNGRASLESNSSKTKTEGFESNIITTATSISGGGASAIVTPPCDKKAYSSPREEDTSNVDQIIAGSSKDSSANLESEDVSITDDYNRLLEENTALRFQLSSVIKERDALKRSIIDMEMEHKQNYNKIVEENKRLSQENNSLIKVISATRSSSTLNVRGASTNQQ